MWKDSRSCRRQFLSADRSKEKELTQLDVDGYLSKIKTEEKNGHYFADILQDYKKVLQSESLREFSFSPEDFVQHPGR